MTEVILYLLCIINNIRSQGKKRSFIILSVTKKVQTYESIWTTNLKSIFLFHYIGRHHHHHHHHYSLE